jgi:hypothetical protein
MCFIIPVDFLPVEIDRVKPVGQIYLSLLVVELYCGLRGRHGFAH